MREYVCVGTPEQIADFRSRWMARAQDLAKELGLPYRLDQASDAFFGRGGKLMVMSQIEQTLKFELLVPVRSAEQPTACMSFNYHQEHFGAAWNLRSAAGQIMHTGCVAFGMDRLALALFATHGLELADWPPAVRQALALHDPTAVVGALTSEVESNSSASSSSSSFPTSIKCRSERYENLAPMLASGKNVLRTVRMRGAGRSPLPGKPTKPITGTERKLLALWQEVLGVDGLGVEDDYFALGGTSLLAARLFAVIAQQFGVKLSLASILEAPTVRALSRLLESQRMEHSSTLVELKRGGPRSLFLVHDGYGATLLYLNLARRMPDSLAVFGIEPRRIPRVPLAHARVEDMAGFYVEELRKMQPHGPYLLGGLCAGGIIAYEMALQLVRIGESIELLALLDAATPQASKRPGRTRPRLQRLTQAVADARAMDRSSVEIVSTAAQELMNAVLRQITLRGRQLSVGVRFRLLRELLMRQRPWPWLIPELAAHQIYDSAEARYVPKPLSDATRIVLVRARGEASETPYCELFADETMGWGAIAQSLIVVDVDGGHSSILQEPSVDSLAATLMPHLGYRSNPTSSRPVEPDVVA